MLCYITLMILYFYLQSQVEVLPRYWLSENCTREYSSPLQIVSLENIVTDVRRALVFFISNDVTPGSDSIPYLSCNMRFPTMWYVQPANTQTACVYAQIDQSLCLSFEYSMTVKPLTEHHLEFLSLKGGCTGSSESTHVKMPHCWKSHVTAHIYISIKR